MLSAIVAQLERLVSQIQASGPVAGVDARLDISTHAKSGYEYARLRNGSELSACGRVGSEKYLEMLATLQRRDKIAHLRNAIASLKQADKIPPKISALTQSLTPIQPPTAHPKSNPPTARKKKGRKRLYTHVKTRQGSVVHAVPGKDKSGAWHTPALCGATPPKRDRMGWEFPEQDDGITCAKCRRKLPANSKRHLPTF